MRCDRLTGFAARDYLGGRKVAVHIAVTIGTHIPYSGQHFWVSAWTPANIALAAITAMSLFGLWVISLGNH